MLSLAITADSPPARGIDLRTHPTATDFLFFAFDAVLVGDFDPLFEMAPGGVDSSGMAGGVSLVASRAAAGPAVPREGSRLLWNARRAAERGASVRNPWRLCAVEWRLGSE